MTERGMTLGELLDGWDGSPIGSHAVSAAPLPEGACGAEEFPVWMDGSQSHVRCELPKGHATEGHFGHFTDDGTEWNF